ncbi:MAG: hypothetical protein M1821_001167 [Bathelium mastoideum]|nr:MAG: hypothetical protein M1821_001167 [Bathelium mastoideum]
MALMYRIFLTIINIFFPPLTVLILAGPGYDCLINCIFFLLAVIPSHIHGFYLSCTYFHRRRKVAKGRWPGGPKFLIESPIILNGGASPAQAAALHRREFGIGGSGISSGSNGSDEYVDAEKVAASSSVRRRKSSRRAPAGGKGSRKRGNADVMRRESVEAARRRSSRPPSWDGRGGGPARRAGSQRASQRYSGAYPAPTNGYIAPGSGPPSRAGSQRAPATAGYVAPVQRAGSVNVNTWVPQRGGSVNAGARTGGYQAGWGSAPVSPVVSGYTAPLGRNASNHAGVNGVR